MIDLEAALVDLAEHLDHPPGDGSRSGFASALLVPAPIRDRRLARPQPDGFVRWSRSPRCSS